MNGIRTDGQTKNLLVYAPEERTTTGSALARYFTEPDLVIDVNVNDENYASQWSTANEGWNPSYKSYYRVKKANDEAVRNVHGHIVSLSSTNGEYGNTDGYHADLNHLLIDKEDFNAPIHYIFSGDYRMWYQRTPEAYVESKDCGWETVSLPFTAERVTTQQKGEITHFYKYQANDNATDQQKKDGNIGHEYWLREFSDITSADKIEFRTIYADMTNSTGKVRGTFLWDYYYSRNSRKDQNNDIYQQYYNQDYTYTHYPLYASGTPYLIGWPGSRYYEFDLEEDETDGFVATTAATTIPAKLNRQIITFLSRPNETINVTDNDYSTVHNTKLSTVTYGDYSYTYMPTYQARIVATDYIISNEISNGTEHVAGFEENTNEATVQPFRAYLTSTHIQSAPKRAGTRADILYISNPGDDSMQQSAANRGLHIYTDHMSICIESTLEYTAQVTITSVAGKILKSFEIQPGTKVTVPVNNRGVYIVNHLKIAVTK